MVEKIQAESYGSRENSDDNKSNGIHGGGGHNYDACNMRKTGLSLKV